MLRIFRTRPWPLLGSGSRLYSTSQPSAGYSESQRAKKSRPPPKRTLILRDFIAESLYARTESYFVNEAPVHDLSQPLDFSSMWSFWSYRNKLYDIFKDVDGFMTPVEIFKPYYAQAIARYLVDSLSKNNTSLPEPTPESDAVDGTSNASAVVQEAAPSQIHLLEVGGGNGTCAAGILDFLKANHPELYNRVVYTIVDVSKPFHERQKQNLQHHAARVRLINKSIFEYDERHDAPGFVIALEILDNLPHDKLVVDGIGHIRETVIEERTTDDGKSVYTESHRPLEDPMILEYLRTYSKHFNLDSTWLGDNSIYSDNEKIYKPLVLWHYLRYPSEEMIRQHFPRSSLEVARHFVDSNLTLRGIMSHLSHFGAATGGVTPQRIFHLSTQSFNLLKRFKLQFPRADLVFADFDYLPDAMPGVNGPLVQRSEGNQTTTYKSYLAAPAGQCDIFYPTNFQSLRIMHHEISGKPSWAVRSKAFLKKYADYRATKTKTGYNPLLHDFVNTQFFITTNGM